MPSLRMLVVGASQGTGALTVSTALARGPQKLTIEHALLTRRAGSFHAAAAVDAAVGRGEGAADLLVTAADSDDWVGKSVQIGG